jgi:hypothetical protein
VPNGHPGGSTATVDADHDGLADDVMVMIPAVGAAGGNALPGLPRRSLRTALITVAAFLV